MGSPLKNGNPKHELTKEEKRKGGKAGRGRQKAKTMKEALTIINTLPLPQKTEKKLRELGFSDDELCYPVAIMIAQVAKATDGDVQAAKFLSELNGEMVQKLAVSNVTDDSTNAFNAFLASKDNETDE